MAETRTRYGIQACPQGNYLHDLTCSQKLLVSWLEPAVSRTDPNAPAWHLAKLVPQTTTNTEGSTVIWTARVHPNTVVHGCVAKLRPKYSFPSEDQADYFAQAIELLKQNLPLSEIEMPPPENPDDENGDLDDPEMDDDIEETVLD